MQFLEDKRQHEQFNYRAEFGTANVQIRCPFCGTVTKAYVWSLTGGGKKCPGCGAIHTGHGMTFRKTPAIGTDVSLEVCRNEGYLMVQPAGRFKQDKQYRVFAYWAHWQGENSDRALAIDTTFSWNDAKRIYEAHKAGLDSFADDMAALMATEKPGYYDLIQAASTINPYCGLN